MPVSAAQLRAHAKHEKKTYERFTIKARKGKRAQIKAYVDSIGSSFNGFVLKAIEDAMKKDTENQSP